MKKDVSVRSHFSAQKLVKAFGLHFILGRLKLKIVALIFFLLAVLIMVPDST
jgi:uncharacterized membrane protein